MVGTSTGHDTVKAGVDALNAAGGFGSGKGSGDPDAMAAEAHKQAELRRQADPEVDPPPLVS